jgi:hypothetical protein
MVSANVTRLVEQVKTLSLEEREQFFQLIDPQPPQRSKLSKEEQVEQLLLERGVISSIRPKLTQADIDRFNAWKPIPIKGKPLSETIIEERR